MKLGMLSSAAQDGLRAFATAIHGDEMMLDDLSSVPEQWAWLVIQLRAAPDRPEWFPRGKWATIQFIEADLIREADELLSAWKRKAVAS